ncbi:MAG: MFS transporter [Clostridiales bacterium]|nr:MFS transporter [Clostridiales bacterium]
MSALLRRFRNHSLVQQLIGIKGNPKVCLVIEPLWGIPYNLIAPFTSVYMYAMGVDDQQIGLLLSIAMVAQVFFSFAGGILTDKLGRRLTTNIGDFVGWSLACFVWAISQNFYFFLIAMLLNCFEQVNQTAWYCLLVEDADKKDILGIHTWVTIAGLLAVFFAPISGWLIGRYSMVPVVRVLYLIFAIFMLIKVFITAKYTTETRQGIRRMQESKSIPVSSMIREYKGVIPLITGSKATMQTLAIMVLFQITNLINTNFMSLFINQNLLISEQYLAYFPILRATIMLIFLFTVQSLLDRLRMKIPMAAGLLVYIAAQLLIIFLPAKQIGGIIIYTMLEAFAFGLFMPRKEAMLSLSVNPKERARIISLLTSTMILLVAPFGYLAGLLSSMDRRLPFALNIILYIIMLLVIARFHEPTFKEGESLAGDEDQEPVLQA